MAVEFEIEGRDYDGVAAQVLTLRVTSTDVQIGTAAYSDPMDEEAAEACVIHLDPSQARQAAEWLLWATGDE